MRSVLHRNVFAVSDLASKAYVASILQSEGKLTSTKSPGHTVRDCGGARNTRARLVDYTGSEGDLCL